MLNIITGRSGCGKTQRASEILAEIAAGGEKCMMIVPDQSTFENEKMFLRLLGPKLAGNVLVFGFTRLCKYIFENTEGKIPLCIDDGDRQLVMSLALEETAQSLSLFSSEKRRGEYIKTLLQTVTDYKKWGITPQMLDDVSSKTKDKMLKAKLSETALVYSAYDAILNDDRENKIDPFDMTEAAYDRLAGTDLFKGMVVAVDSFRDFTSRQTKLLSKIMERSSQFYMTVTDDPTAPDGSGLFASTRANRRIFENQAKENNIEISRPVVLQENKRFENEELLYLERGFLSGSSETCDDTVENVFLSRCGSIYSEAEKVACEIKKLIVEENFRYGDISVVFRHGESYAPVLATVFDKYEIPYFCDIPEDISVKPLIRLIKGCISAAVSGFDREEVLKIMKTGLTNVTAYETSVFENYLLMWSITGKNLTKPFTANPSGFGAEMGEKEQAELMELEAIRQKIMTPLMNFKNSCDDTGCREISKSLYQLLKDLHTEEQLENMYQSLSKLGLENQSEEQVRLWEMVMGILDKMVMILGDSRLTLKRYSELLDLQFQSSEIAFIPEGLDRVTMGQADRIRLNGTKAVFIVGAIEGQFPTVPVEEGIFSDREKKELYNLGLPASDFFEEVLNKEKFIAYYALSASSKKVFVSWYRTSLSGDENEPSVIVREILRIFPQIHIETDEFLEPEQVLWCEKPSFELCAKKYGDRTSDGFAFGLVKYFENSEEYKNKMKALERAVKRSHSSIENPDIARALFGKNFAMSASQAEKYHLCPFSYFCTYGLKAQERKTAKMTPSEYGTIIHYILENYFKDFDREKILTKEEIVSKVQELLEQYSEKYLGEEAKENHSLMFLMEKLRDNAAGLIERISEELSQSEFVPRDFELSIGKDIEPYKIETEESASISVYGVIDRVDVMEKNGETYVRIIDYKTGKKEFKLSDILFGLNMQMLIYMEALCQGTGKYKGTKPIPAGILYMPSGSVFVDSDFSMESGKIQQEIDKERKMKGLVLNNDTVIKGMEKNVGGVYLPVKLNKSGDKYTSTESLVNAVEIKRIFDKINSILKKMVKELLNGKIGQVPAKGTTDACAFCPYWQVCGYEEGMESREVFKLSKSDVMEILENEEADSNGKTVD